MAGRIPARIRVHTATPLIYGGDTLLTGSAAAAVIGAMVEGGAAVAVVSAVEDGGGALSEPEYVEGERGTAVEATPGEPFACVVFLPGGGDQPGGPRIRTVTQPTVLYNPTRDVTDAARGLVADQSPVLLSANSELLVDAPDLAGFTGGETVRWQVVGEPQPLGPPGRVVAVQATLRQVRD